MNSPESFSADSLLAPDVGALVEYGLDSFGKNPAQYRVTGWMRAAPPPVLDPDDFLGEILFESCREFPDAAGGAPKRMQNCLRFEATHLSLTGICGAIAPITACKVTGMVAWPAKQLEDARERAYKKGAAHQMLF